MKNILVTIDFDDSPHRLIEQASALAEKFDSKIWIVHVAAPNPDFVGYEAGPPSVREGRAHELRKEHQTISKYTDNLKEKGFDAEGLLIQGATIKMILDESKRLKADLIIMGYHEHGLLYQAFIGSTTSEIIKKTNIPVLIIPELDA